MKTIGIWLLVSCLVSCSCRHHPQADSSQSRVVFQFYQAVLGLDSGGIPAGQDFAAIEPFISGRLCDLLVRGREAERLYSEKTNRAVPPLIEGSLFMSLFEGADRILGCRPEPPPAKNSYLVEFEYGSETDGNMPFRWMDRCRVIFEDGRWVVDEIELLGDWSFGMKGKVSEILMDAEQTARDAQMTLSEQE